MINRKSGSGPKDAKKIKSLPVTDRLQWMYKHVMGEHILIIGCGKGVSALFLGRKGYQVTGIDCNKDNINNANQFLVQESDFVRQNVNFQVKENFKIENKPGNFDTVIIEEVPSYLTNPKKVFSLGYQLLKYQGKLIFIDDFSQSNAHYKNGYYYLSNIASNLEVYFRGDHLEIIDRYVCYTGVKRETTNTKKTLEDFNPKQLAKWLKIAEKLFLEIKTSYQDLLIKHEKLEQTLSKTQKTAYHVTPNASFRYKIGDAFFRALRSWKEAVRLPITLYRLYKEAKGKQKVPSVIKVSLPGSVEKIESRGNGVVFVPTNGAGLGHLTRLLAIARRLRDLDPKKEIIFFTTSSAMHLILQEGFLGYHLPSKMLLPDSITSRQWNTLLEEQLSTIIELHQPNMLVFDGAFPYAGLVSSMQQKNALRKVWVKRGLHKEGKAELVQSKEKDFHEVIIPGEAGISAFENKGKQHHCDPVIYLDKSELLDRDKVRNQWNIPEESKLVYVQLGAGNINDINSTIGMILSELKKREDVYIVIGESIIGERLDINEDRVIILRDYPNSMYFNAFDVAITAAGYNTFHELMYLGLPSILIPNENTKTDDQVVRAMIAHDASAAIVLREPSTEAFANALEEALRPEMNQIMRKAAKDLVKINGADQIARLLLDFDS